MKFCYNGNNLRINPFKVKYYICTILFPESGCVLMGFGKGRSIFEVCTFFPLHC